jgi:hypothetical protein
MSNARKVSTDALETLGQIIDETQKRDAIHIAVLPIVAAERLHAGQDVGITAGGASTKVNHVGIVDPFLKVPVHPGQRFWLLLYPRMVTSLRHVWSHPAFTDDETAPDPRGAKSLAEATVRAMADEAGISYEEMLESAREFAKSQDYRCDGGRWEGVYAGDDFWNAYEIVTGEKVDEDKRGGIFTCSC